MLPNWADRTLWTGDNLDIMRGMNSESVDLIYLDPPFNSNRTYSAPIGSKAAGAAFKDTWTLSDVDEAWHGEIADRDPSLYAIIDATGLSHGRGMKSYLIMMAVRLLEMRRLLKDTGSIYLHCDPDRQPLLETLRIVVGVFEEAVDGGLEIDGRAIGHLVGGQDYHDRLRSATFAREVLERLQELKRDWNRQVERAAEEGVHVIYTDGYDHLHKELDSVSKNMLLDRGVKSEISAVLAQLGKAMSTRNYFDNWPKLMAGQMDRREALAAKAAERGVAVHDHEDYDTWRNVTDFAVGRC